MQILDYERQILECENRFWRAKELPTASRRIFLPALRAGEFFSPEITAGFFFFAKPSCNPPIKIKWSFP